MQRVVGIVVSLATLAFGAGTAAGGAGTKPPPGSSPTSSSPPSPPSSTSAAGGGSDRPEVDLPGLVDTSDEALPLDPDVRTGTLPNGLRYYVRHNERPGGKAELRLAVNAGSVNETGPHTGVAHFVEHMLFNGTERYPENELLDVLASFGAEFGADINAYTSYDETVYELSVPARGESVDTGLDVLDQWLSHATFDPAQVEAERGVITDEWRQSTQSVGGRLFDIAGDLYLDGGAYEGRDPIGTAESIGEVPAAELRQFYDDWYRPDNAAIVVVGDIEVDEIVADIEQRFADAEPRTPVMPERPDTAFAVDGEPAFALHSDPDQQSVDVEVTLPLPAVEGDGTAALRAGLLDSMIFELLLRRLDDDASTGEAPFDQIGPGTNSFVRGLDAPALYAFTDGERVDATLQALLDEYERASRFGFSESEAALARTSAQASIDAQFERADAAQDVDFANMLVANFLAGQPYTALADSHPLTTEMIAAVTPEALAERFRARWDNSAPHIIISTPAGDEASMPTEADVQAMIADLAERPLDARDGGTELPTDLMAIPDAVEPVSDEPTTSDGIGRFDPFVLEFPNGARVVATTSSIVEGQVDFLGSSLGGSSLVADGDVVDALFAADVVTSGGVGDFSRTQLDAMLADRDVFVEAWITPYTENFGGGASTSDLETLFQLVNLYMTAPRYDQVVLSQLQRSYQPAVDRPESDPGLAGADALVDARYGKELRYTVLPSPSEFATLDLDGIERVWSDRFGDAGDWVFTFAGDFDPDVLRDLAARYIGSLPGAAVAEEYVDVSLAPPPGVIESTVEAGTGEASRLSLLFTTPVSGVDAELRATTDVTTQVLNGRLIDVIREELGESYSPSAGVSIVTDPEPAIETYVEVSGAPERIDAVGDLVVAELADLAANGPTEEEFSEAYAQVEESYNFVGNGMILQMLINSLLWPEGEVASYVDVAWSLPEVTESDVQQFIADHVPAEQYVQVTVVSG